MSNNFEQKFIQNVQTNASSINPSPKTNKHNILLICFIVIALLQLVITIIMCILMFNILNDQSGEEYYGFSYDKAGNYSAISAFCENDSNYYEFYDDNTYIYDDFYEYGHELNTEEPYDDGILDAGSYNFSDNKTIELKSEKSNDTKRLSFDSASVKDGDIIYFCNLFE